jgi:hypothetical protein
MHVGHPQPIAVGLDPTVVATGNRIERQAAQVFFVDQGSDRLRIGAVVGVIVVDGRAQHL